MKKPVACTLSVQAAGDRVSAWRDALGASVRSTARPMATRLELGLDVDPNQVATLVDLARLETACCGFFSFAFVVEADTVTLAVSVPPDAAAVLDDFARLASAQ